ncbi:uncharacterized protein BX663DRAFT_328036 [Cokeromyces recurvatus]|uniref:uncharacterized protein n=1 Tax=Cokeromyces recurvatus TaxID=90255 RepID=UPI00221F6E32|nr:uncharacterized protein BX663DRAFT_328036 [Cokeromyces recurvatus]KAI7904781.1 hypothetical protein BX663DRAFT_328036 [Cokeromyces recurvatus]
MSNKSKYLKNKNIAFIGLSVAAAITAYSVWNWSNSKKKQVKSSNKKQSVKHIDKSIANSNEHSNIKQSQIKEIKENLSNVVTKEENTANSTDIKEEHTQFILSSLSTTSSSVDEADICTPEPETSNDEKQSEITSTLDDTQKSSVVYIVSNIEKEGSLMKQNEKMDRNDNSNDAVSILSESIVIVEQDEIRDEAILLKSIPNEATDMDEFTDNDDICTTAIKNENDSVNKSNMTDSFIEIEATTIEDTMMNNSDITESFVDAAAIVQSVINDLSVDENDSININNMTSSDINKSDMIDSFVSNPHFIPESITTVRKSVLTADAPEFIPKSLQQRQQKPKKSHKKLLTREQLIEHQKQSYIPQSKSRCTHWPHCTNNNCKFFHPYKECRAGNDCVFGKKCMFVHPNDCIVTSRQ